LKILIKDYEDMHNFSVNLNSGIFIRLPGGSLA
jgi:hypothetical protein